MRLPFIREAPKRLEGPEGVNGNAKEDGEKASAEAEDDGRAATIPLRRRTTRTPPAGDGDGDDEMFDALARDGAASCVPLSNAFPEMTCMFERGSWLEERSFST